MRRVGLLPVLLIAAACTEIGGATVVRYEVPTAFYVRHLTWVDDEAGVDAMAAQVCDEMGGRAKLIAAHQAYGLDTRDAIYQCTEGDPDSQPPEGRAALPPAGERL